MIGVKVIVEHSCVIHMARSILCWKIFKSPERHQMNSHEQSKNKALYVPMHPEYHQFPNFGSGSQMIIVITQRVFIGQAGGWNCFLASYEDSESHFDPNCCSAEEDFLS